MKINKLSIFWLILLIVFLVITCRQTHAQDFSEKIGKNSKITYFELLRMVFPDLDKDGNARQTSEIRVGIDTDETRPYEEKMKIFIVRKNLVNTENGSRLILIIKAVSDEQNEFPWGELNVIALFSNGSKPNLLDAVEVSGDRENLYWGELQIHPKLSLSVFEYKHHNAGENYDAFSFFYAENNKIRETLKVFPYLYYGRVCQTEISETGNISTVKNPKSIYRDVIFKIKVTGKKFAEDCETLKTTTVKYFTPKAIWKNGKFMSADGNAELKRMQREEKRLGFGKEN